MGKNATSQAQISSERSTSLAQMMMSGAMATIGVTCRTMAYGNSDSSTHCDSENSTASRPPTTTAASSASSVMPSVTSSEGNNVLQSAISVSMIKSGPGRM